jgi:crotonobetainyl-CoA:carnitine CoA-transferase CaiB-like acyl-CoA transferase
MAPHGAYACSEPESWVAIAVATDAQWSALVDAIGSPAWALAPALRSLSHRLERRKEIDRGLAAWTKTLTATEVTRRLQAVGVAAGPVYSPVEVMDDPQLQSRGFFPEVPHALLGSYARPNVMWRLSETPSSIYRGANTLGEHNHQVVCDLLGLSETEYADLVSEGLIGTEYAPGSEVDPA